MARTIFSLVGRIKTEGLDTLGKGLLAIDEKLTKTARKIDRFGRNVSKIGANVTKITAPLGIAAIASVKFGADFEKSMTNSLAIMGNVSDQMKARMGDAARTVAKESTFSAKEAADAYFFLASAGLDAAQTIEALPRVTKFAQAGNFDLALATDLLTDAQSALGLSSKDTATAMLNMSRVSDVLVKANTIANASVQQFSESLTNKAGAALRLLGKEVEEGAAVLAVYADQGLKGAGAGESLNIVLRDLQKASINNRKEFDAAGISVFDAAGNMRNMADIVAQLEDHLGDMSDEQKRTALSTLGFTDKSISATTALIGTSDAIRRYEKDLRSAGGLTDQVSEKQLQSLWAQLEIIKNKLIDVAIGFSETLVPILKDSVLPVIESIVQALTGLVTWFSSLPKGTRKAIMAIVAFITITGPFLIGVGKMISSVTLLATSFKALRFIVRDVGRFMKANPIFLMATAFTALAGAIFSTVDATEKQVDAQKELNEVQAESEAAEKRRAILRKNFIATMKEAKGFMEIASRAEAQGLESSVGWYKQWHQSTERAVRLAQQMGRTIKGTASERAKSVELIFREIQGIRDSNGNLVTYIGHTNKSKKTIQQRSEALDEWNKKVEEQKASELELVEIKREAAKAALDEKDRTAAALSAIDTFYDTEKKKVEDAQTKRLIENASQAGAAAGQKRDAEIDYLNAVTLATAEATGRELEALNMRRDAELQAAEESLSKTEEVEAAKQAIREKYSAAALQLAENTKQEKQAKRLEDVEAVRAVNEQRFQMAVGMVGQLSAIGRADTQNKLTRIQQELHADKERIKNSMLSEEEKAEAIGKIEEISEKKQVALKRKQARRDKVSALFSAGISAVQMAMNGFNTQPFLPLGLIMGGIATALGLGMAATIAAKPLPQLASGGLAKRRAGGTPVIVGEGADDEAILPMRTGALEIARNIVRSIGDTVLPKAPARSASGLALAGAAPSRTVNLNIGTYIGNRQSLTELERRLYTVRTAENQRKGF